MLVPEKKPISLETRRAIAKMMAETDGCESCGGNCNGDRKLCLGLFCCTKCRKDCGQPIAADKRLDF